MSPQIIHRDLKSLNILLANVIRSQTDEPLAKVKIAIALQSNFKVALLSRLQTSDCLNYVLGAVVNYYAKLQLLGHTIGWHLKY